MSVISSNPFALLGDDEPVEAPVQVKSEEKQQSKPRQNKVVPGNNKGGKFFKEGKNGQSDTTPFEQAPEHKGERGPSRSGRGGRGRGGARRGRAFDRHSGSGFKDGEKKEVAGHSWGDPVASALEGAPATEESPADGWNGDSVPPAAEDGAAGFEDAEPAEPEPEYKTLDEFLSSNSAAAKKAAEARRKANEGVDESQWKGTTLLKKEEQLDSWFAGLAVNNKSAAKKKERQAKTTLEIEQTFAAPREERGGFRGGRGRGQRGGSRGGQRGAPRGGRGGRGGSRGGRNEQVDVADTNAFPSLGA